MKGKLKWKSRRGEDLMIRKEFGVEPEERMESEVNSRMEECQKNTIFT